MGSRSRKARLNGKPDATATILDSISDGVFTVDERWCITSFNRAASEITGVARKAALGKPCSEVFWASMCETDCALRRTIESGKPIVSSSAFIVTAEGRRLPISLSTAVLHDAGGRVIGGVETFHDLSLVEELRKQIEGRRQMGDLVSRSVAMRRVFDIIPQVAESSSTAFIVGETGTGKELLAHAIHDFSPRRESPFIAVNCGALPDTLLESELFGYVAGAFTGADKNKPGRFALAEGGTLFLDEIGDVSPALQVRLLRVLQEKTYEPLGGTVTVKCNVRIIAATNSDLATEVEKGAFRRDLYYRINVVRIDLPPLRGRREDIPLLVDHFVSRLNIIQGKSVCGVDPEVMAVLMAHDYPGNVRELENIIEHAFVLARDGETGLKHLPENLVARNSAAPGSAGLRTTVHAAEVQAIRQSAQDARPRWLVCVLTFVMVVSTGSRLEARSLCSGLDFGNRMALPENGWLLDRFQALEDSIGCRVFPGLSAAATPVGQVGRLSTSTVPEGYTVVRHVFVPVAATLRAAPTWSMRSKRPEVGVN